MRRVKPTQRKRRSTSRRRPAARAPWLRLPSWRLDISGAHRRLVLAGGGLAAALAVIGGLYWTDRANIPARIATATQEAVVDMTLWAGFSVREVYVSGRKEADRNALLEALEMRVGDPILFFDTERARDRVMKLGWIGDARIERRLPDTVRVFLDEREPAAIWQRNKRFVLVDNAGAVIGPEGLERYRHLKIIVGEDAPKHAAALLAMLESDPEMMQRVTHAVWVSGRRWNIRIEDAIDIRLPAEDPETAWRKLTELEREFGLLRRDITAVDLRVPDRLTVRRDKKPASAARHDGQT